MLDCVRSALLLVTVAVFTPAAAQNSPSQIEGDLVSAASRAPMEGVTVRLTPAKARVLSTISDANGHFEFAGLPEGSYRLTVDKPGLPPLVTMGGVPAINVHGPIPPLHLRVAPGVTVEGTVFDRDGKPLPHIIVSVLQRPWYVGGRLTTNDVGEYHTVPLEPGTYIVAVNATGSLGGDPKVHTTYYPSTYDLTAAEVLTLAPGDHVRADVHIVRELGVRVAGRIDLPSLGGDVHATITLALRYDHLAKPLTTTSTGGRYEFPEVLPGKYNLIAVVKPNGSGPLWGSLRRVDIPGADPALFDFDPAELPDLWGTVSADNGCPAPVPLQLWVSSNSPPHIKQPHIEWGVDGSFRVTQLPPGDYILGYTHLNASGRIVKGGSEWISASGLGEADVARNGFTFPSASGGPLKITIHCPGPRR